jgi:hypothetical protein
MNVRSFAQPEIGSTAPAVGPEEPLAILNATPFLLTRCTAKFEYANVAMPMQRGWVADWRISRADRSCIGTLIL